MVRAQSEDGGAAVSSPPSARAATPGRLLAGRPITRAGLAAHLRVPLHRDGYALMLNSVLVSVFGLLYWLIAARYYSPHWLGLNSAAISAMMFLAGVAQLNLMSALQRFVPISGARSRRFILVAYLVSVGVASFATGIFLVGLESWAPDLGFLGSTPAFVIWFAAATMAWCIFNLQDSALIGLRSAVFVPVENLVFSVGKIALLVAFIGLSPHYGIFASWTAALLLCLLPVNILIFRRLLPRHIRESNGSHSAPTRRQLATYVSADYVGSLFWLAAVALMPVIVLAIEGATANAYFSLAWMIALPLYLLTSNTGASLVVTASRDEGQLAAYARRAVLQSAGVVIPLALLLAALAPFVLDLFGAEYAEHSSATLTLLALAAIPNVITALYACVYRVQRRMRRVVLVMGLTSTLVIGLGVALLHPFGVIGVGIAWLVAQLVVASALLIADPRGLGLFASRAAHPASSGG